LHTDSEQLHQLETVVLPLLRIVFGDVRDKGNLSYILQVLGLGYLTSEIEEHHRKSIEFFKEALKLRTENFGEFSEETGETNHNLGLVYSKLNETEKSIEHYKKAIEIKEKVYGSDSHSTANSMSSLGSIYFGSVNEIEKAKELFEKAYKIMQLKKGKNSIEV